MVSTRPPTSKSSRPFNNPLITVPKAPITIGIIVTFMIHSFFQFSNKVEVLISLFTFFQIYSVVSRDRKVDNLADFVFLLIIIRSGLLAGISWSVCILKSHRSFCMSFSRTGAGLCIYHLLAWSNLNFLHISQWITLPTQSCLTLFYFQLYFQSLDNYARLKMRANCDFYAFYVLIFLLSFRGLFFLSASFLHHRYLVAFHWSLSDCKFPADSRPLFSIRADLNNVVVWFFLWFTYPSIFFSKILRTVPSAPTIISIVVIFMLHRFFISLAISKYLFIFSLSFIFTQWPAGTAKSTSWQALFNVLLKTW